MSPLSLVEILPQELIDRLIDTLHLPSDGDELREQPHLKTCALVCRAFRPRAQNHLFSYIKLTSIRVCECSKIIKRTPSIAAAVRTLHLEFYNGRLDWVIGDGSTEFVYIVSSITGTTSLTSTSLCKLKLEGGGSSIKNPELFLEHVFKPFFAPFITSLYIETLYDVPIDIIDSCVGLTELASVFASLQHGHAHAHTRSSPPRHKLKKLEFNDPDEVKRLATADHQTQLRLDLSELRSLSVDIHSGTEATFEQSIIDECAQALEELCFKNFNDPKSQLGCSIDLKTCHNLRILSLDINMLGHQTPGSDEDGLHTLSRVLSTLPKSTSLDTLRLTAYVGYVLPVDDPQNILNADWAGFQSRLVDIAAGKAFFEFSFRMLYMNWDGDEYEEYGEDVGERERMRERCSAALDRLLTEKLDLLTKHPCISVVNLGYYVQTPVEW